jgi:hypothetical protein
LRRRASAFTTSSSTDPGRAGAFNINSSFIRSMRGRINADVNLQRRVGYI